MLAGQLCCTALQGTDKNIRQIVPTVFAGRVQAGKLEKRGRMHNGNGSNVRRLGKEVPGSVLSKLQSHALQVGNLLDQAWSVVLAPPPLCCSLFSFAWVASSVSSHEVSRAALARPPLQRKRMRRLTGRAHGVLWCSVSTTCPRHSGAPTGEPQRCLGLLPECAPRTWPVRTPAESRSAH